MHEENLVEDWCFELGLENEGWLGKGEFGNAYNISGNKVIKITTDYNEFISASKLLDKNISFNAKIYSMRIFPNGEMGILMERLVTDDIENIFLELSMAADELETDILNIDIDEAEYLSEEAKKLANDLYFAHQELRHSGSYALDIHDGNIGLNQEGNYALFDQTEKRSLGYNEDEFEDLKEKLKDQYSIEDDEPIYKKDVCISKILVNRESLFKTLNDIMNGKFSKSSDDLECIYNSQGNLQLIDGHHRLLEGLLTSKNKFDIKITMDERFGYHHPYFARIEKEKAIELDPDMLYGGLEDLADDEILNECLESYVEFKKTKLLTNIKNQKKENIIKLNKNKISY